MCTYLGKVSCTCDGKRNRVLTVTYHVYMTCNYAQCTIHVTNDSKLTQVNMALLQTSTPPEYVYRTRTYMYHLCTWRSITFP